MTPRARRCEALRCENGRRPQCVARRVGGRGRARNMTN